MNYFSLFNIDQSYAIDLAALQQRFMLLQRVTHPDKYASASDNEKRMYMQKNAQVNDGYHVLKDDVLRGLHLLSIRGFELTSEQDTIGDTAFLMQQMELREDLAEATSKAEFDALHKQVATLIEGFVDAVAVLLKVDDEKNNQAAELELRKLKFLVKLASEVKQREQTIISL